MENFDQSPEVDLSRTSGGGFLVELAAGDSISFRTDSNSSNYTVSGYASLVKVS